MRLLRTSVAGFVLTAGIAVVIGGCAGSKSATTTSDSAIAQYVAAIDGGFAAMKGKQFGDNAIVTKYFSTLAVPNTNACVISHVKRSGDTIATCFFVSASQAAADAAFVAAKGAVKTGAPQLTGGDEPPTNGNLAQFFVKDAAHAVYVDEGQQDDGKYTVVTSFGTPGALQ
jgi:hypothetical protein